MLPILVTGLVLLGCDEDPLTPLSRFPETAPRIEIKGSLIFERGDAITAQVVLSNPSLEPQRLTFPDTCVILLRAYFIPNDRRAWDQLDGKKNCQEQDVEVVIDPGGERPFEESISSLGILGLTLPEGPYRIAAYLRPLGEEEVEVDLGPTNLERPTPRTSRSASSDPLPPPRP